MNGQGSCARGEGSVKAATLSAEATTPAVISQGSGRAQATAQGLWAQMRRAGTGCSVFPNTNSGNSSGWGRRLESSE